MPMNPESETDSPSSTTRPAVVLASASPRRRELLATLGCDFVTAAANIDETPFDGESAAAYTLRMAREKALKIRDLHTHAWIIGADTTVVVDDTILGKPADPAEAQSMLRRLSGRWHEVLSAVTLIGPAHQDTRLNVTRVRFAELPDRWIAQYVAGDEPMDKAGGYAIQGAAAHWIPEIQGSYTGVMGLPLFETVQLLHAAGLP